MWPKFRYWLFCAVVLAALIVASFLTAPYWMGWMWED